MSPETLQIGATILFAIAVIHTFSVKFFEKLAERPSPHVGIWHLLAEVEVVFGFWAMILIVYLALFGGVASSLDYLESRNFTEPMFIFVIMVVAASKPIFNLAQAMVENVARILPLPSSVSTYLVIMALVPLLGSFITEPAAMTLAALLLRDQFYSAGLSNRLQYATIGVLFVNVSIGGALTPFAAPPILMVAGTWGWDLPFMLLHFGWRSTLAVFINAIGVTLLFRAELARITLDDDSGAAKVPFALTIVHLLFLLGIVIFAHHAVVFMALFLFFLGITAAYPRHQDPLILREGLLVGFFLGGLVVLGGQQQWWLQPLLEGMSPTVAYYGATALTAITDNAALTYLGSLVEGLSPEFKYSLVAGAITGGGLTVIANAPNPAGYSILKKSFEGESISPLGILVSAAIPTIITILVFRVI
ncbi:MAG TPA: putative Na+/H+ antiporter [Salinisphaeraceae bacterium]|nr:putative Na+/H+ antiporter [Salinisphaeraceae bacterium]